MKIGFIGVGNMAGAILQGIISAKVYERENIFVKNSSLISSKNVSEKYGVNYCETYEQLIERVDIIVLGVKPHLVGNILEEIKNYLNNKLLISIAAAVDISYIENIVGKQKIVRVMPNTAVFCQSGVSGIVFNTLVEREEKEIVLNIFNSIGHSEVIAEKDIEALTALSGSGPAYVYMFIESLINGAVLNGLSANVAKKLAVETVIGAAKMIQSSDEHIAKLRDDVCSPAGSTIEAVRTLEKSGFRSAIIECQRDCFIKLEKMKQDNN